MYNHQHIVSSTVACNGARTITILLVESGSIFREAISKTIKEQLIEHINDNFDEFMQEVFVESFPCTLPDEGMVIDEEGRIETPADEALRMEYEAHKRLHEDIF
jgi:hypothetical protein